MKWDRKNREYWCLGDQKPFYLTKASCVAFLHALVACDGAIHESFSLDFHEGNLMYGMKPFQCASTFLLSLPVGTKDLFEQIYGDACLTKPPKVCANTGNSGAGEH